MALLGTPEKSVFEKIVGGLGKSGSLGRKAIAGALFNIGADASTSGILKGREDYTAREFMNDVGKKYNLDLEFGSKVKKSGMDKILNFGTELATDIMTDPLTLLGTGVAKMAAPIASSLKLGKAGTLALKGAMTGAVLGSATGDDAGEAAINAAIGASTLGLGPKLLSFGGKQFLTRIGNPSVDWAMKKLNPEVFVKAKLGFSEAFDTVKASQREYGDIAREIRQTDNMFGFTKLGPEESRQLSSILDDAYSATATRRNTLEHGLYSKQLGLESVDGIRVNNSLINPESFGETVAYQELRTSGQKFGNRVILAKVGDDFTRLLAKDGSNNFVASGIGKNIDDLMPKDAKKFALIDGVKGFDDIDTIKYGMKNYRGEAVHKLTNSELSTITRESNVYVGKIVDEQLAKIGDEALSKNVWNWRTRNREIMGNYNRRIKAKLGDAHIPVEPIDFHTLEVRPKEDFIKGVTGFDNITEGFVKRSSDAPIQTAGLTFQERIQLEADRFHKNYLSKQQKEALRIVDGVRYHNVGDKFKEAGKLKGGLKTEKIKEVTGDVAFKKVVDKYDDLTQFMKQQHLTFSHSWIVNNFTDNIIKSYMTGGAKNAWGTMLSQTKAAFRTSSDDLVSDLLKLSDPNEIAKGIPFKSDLADVAVQHGAISEGFFKEAFADGKMSEALLRAKVGPEEASRIMMEATNTNDLSKLYGKYQEFIGATVGRTGTLMEGAARATTFKHTVESIIKDDGMLKELGVIANGERVRSVIRGSGYAEAKKIMPSLSNVYDEASRVSNETFFDYSNISAFEDKVMKRIFPYWTYFSKNLKQWPELIAKNPERFSNVTKVVRNTGTKPTDRQRLGLPEHLLEKGVRIGSDGKAITIPNISLQDAISFTTKPFSSSGEKVHPLIKLAQQLAFSKDEFGGELLPSNTRTGQKRAFGAAVKFAPFTDAIFRDKRRGGKLFTDSDVLQVLQTAQKNLMPVPAIDTIAKMINGISEGDSKLDTILNLGPLKQTTIKKQDAARTRRFRIRDEQMKRVNEQRRKLNKR